MLEMFSQQGEKVEFERPVDAKGNIEVWLQRLVEGMQGTVKHVIKRAVRNIYVSRLGASVGWVGGWVGELLKSAGRAGRSSA